MAEDQFIHQNRIRQVFFLAAIVFLGVLLAIHLFTFLPALLGAITLYLLSRKWMYYLTDQRKWRKSLAAVLILVVTLLIIMVPIGLLVQMLSSKVSYAIQHANDLVESLKIVIQKIELQIGYDIITPEKINQLGTFLVGAIPKVLNATFNTLIIIFFMYFILFFMLVNGRNLEKGIYDYIPLKNENVDKLGHEMRTIVIANAIGIPVIAICQGTISLIGYFILGVKEPLFWFGLTCLTSMLPVVGAALAYVPIAIIFFANDQILQGVILLLYGFGVVGTMDNVLRFTLARKIGKVHPLITVFGVIVGLELFGFIGLIFGPLLISLFILMLKIYSNEFMVKKQEIS
ncbi:MAG: AI-2E family transporter [Saprospiraceae bacterium]